MDNKKSIRTAAILITTFLILIMAACLLYLAAVQSRPGNCIADIYRNGQLIQSIPLDRVSEPYTLEIEGDNGCYNRIEVRPGSIGVISADCPDLLCAKQGFIYTPTIPITCLPNKLVIRLRPADHSADGSGTDAITY